MNVLRHGCQINEIASKQIVAADSAISDLKTKRSKLETQKNRLEENAICHHAQKQDQILVCC